MHKASLSLYCAFSNAMLLHSVFMSRTLRLHWVLNTTVFFLAKKRERKQEHTHNYSLTRRLCRFADILVYQYIGSRLSPSFQFFFCVMSILTWTPPLCRIKRRNSQRSSLSLSAFRVRLNFCSSSLLIIFQAPRIGLTAHLFSLNRQTSFAWKE